MIRTDKNGFFLETDNTIYAFKVLENGYLQHLYYGSRERLNTDGGFTDRNTAIRYSENFEHSLSDIPLECSSIGKGDIREPLVVITYEDACFSSDFIYDSYIIHNGKNPLSTLPSCYGADEELVVYLKERVHNITLELHYSVFVKENVIVRSSKLINSSSEVITVNRLMSSLTDFKGRFDITSFSCAWANEMNKNTTHLEAGKFVVSSNVGISSYKNNPFFMISNNADEDKGECYGFNLIYSGNHYNAIETDVYGNTRVVSGINPDMFSYQLNEGEFFEAPEIVISYSDKGFNGLSYNLHEFVKEHIIRGKFKKEKRPVLLNSWEANYFDITEDKLIKLAEYARQVGIEMLVVDDGWFKKRNGDNSSLGDWIEDKNKLPNGLNQLAQKVNALGLKFGLWFEPEMVSVDSDLYRAHKDWTIEYTNHSEGRNQRILDLVNPDVVQYVIEAVSNVLDSANIEYVKWDMNRIFSDVYSSYQKGSQTEIIHRYYISLYKIMDTLTKKYPNVLFEGCASGGTRFDLGILCYFYQNWASDNTDAVCRMRIQNAYSYAYPQLVYTNHVSICPNHQTGKTVSLENRFKIACAGNLGYELDFTKLTKDEIDSIKKQVSYYKENQELLQFGKFERTKTGWKISNSEKEIEIDLQNVRYID